MMYNNRKILMLMYQVKTLVLFLCVVSAVLLSLGGFIAIVMQNVRKSRCTNISCGISKCSRVVPDIEEEDRPSDLKV
jgi:hypothetical protein